MDVLERRLVEPLAFCLEIERLTAHHAGRTRRRERASGWTLIWRSGCRLSARRCRESRTRGLAARRPRELPWPRRTDGASSAGPRRRSSSSMAGRSSCTSEYACTSSTDTAIVSSESSGTPQSSPLAYTSEGRTRLPPPSTEYCIASRSRLGTFVSAERIAASCVSILRR